jgi:hypothetical protein
LGNVSGRIGVETSFTSVSFFLLSLSLNWYWFLEGKYELTHFWLLPSRSLPTGDWAPNDASDCWSYTQSEPSERDWERSCEKNPLPKRVWGNYFWPMRTCSS